MRYLKVAVPDDFNTKEQKLVIHPAEANYAAETTCSIWEPQYRDILDKGFIGLVDFMGDDQSIVDAARVSYGRGTRRVSEDRGLIRYMIRHHHWTPVEMVEIKWHVKAPIFVFRQWHRHRAASINEYSARYSIMSDDMYMPHGDDMMHQSSSNKQGRAGQLSDQNVDACQLQLQNIYSQCLQAYRYLLGMTPYPDDSLQHRFLLIQEAAMEKIKWLQENHQDWRPPAVTTDEMINDKITEICKASGLTLTDKDFWDNEAEPNGLSRELARIAMPLATYSEMYWKSDLRNTLNFLSLRCDPHAQKEIRDYANAMLEMIEPITPIAIAAFVDYQMRGRQFSSMELDVVKQLYQQGYAEPCGNQEMIEEMMTERGSSKREIKEFLDFLNDEAKQ